MTTLPSHKRPALPAGVLILALLSAAPLATLAQSEGQEATGFETPPVLQAADLVDPALLEGPRHTVDAETRNDGFMNHFTVRTDFGDLTAESEALLRVRVREVEALAKLAELSRTEAFATALAQAATRPVTAVRNLATQPVETVKGVPAGLGRRFRGMYYKAKKTTRKVSAEVKEELARDDEDTAIESDSDVEADPDEDDAEDDAEDDTMDKAVDTAKKVAGWESAKRDLARRLGVDPYSTNPLIQAELERLASAAFAGGLAFKLAVPPIDALSKATDVNALVWELPARELERRNDKAMKKMGVDGSTRFALIDNGAFSLSLQTRLVAALETMTSTVDRGALVAIAAAAESDLEAHFFAGCAELLADYHHHVRPLRQLVAIGNDELGELVAAIDDDGALVVAAPVDYLIWQAGMGGGALSGYADRQLWTTGRLSPRAHQELRARGWSIHTETDFEN